MNHTRCYIVACPSAVEIWPSYTVVRAANWRSAVALCRKALVKHGCLVAPADFISAPATKFDVLSAITPGTCYEYSYAVSLLSARSNILGQLGLT